MKAKLSEIIHEAQRKGHDLKSLANLLENQPSFNSEVDIADPRIKSIEDLPRAEFDLKQIEEAARKKNELENSTLEDALSRGF